MPPPLRFLLLLATVAASAALGARPARANMADPVQPGSPVGEPSVALDGLRVVREVLTLDLRPLADQSTWAVSIEAVYRIENGGGRRLVPLEFLSLGDGLGSPEVWLDGRPVAAQTLDSLSVPPAWAEVETTPALGGDPAPYRADDALGRPGGFRFTLDLAPGAHEVRVRYRVRPGSYDGGDDPNRIWQLAYSLAPARRWAGFGGLDVAVLLASGWEAAASVPLDREAGPDGGDRLVGHFDGVPSDVLAVSARAPRPAAFGLLRTLPVLVPILLVGLAGWLVGRALGRSGRTLWWAVPVSVLTAAVAAIASFLLTASTSGMGDSSAYGYGATTVGAILGIPLVFLLGMIATQITAVAVARRHRRAAAVSAPLPA